MNWQSKQLKFLIAGLWNSLFGFLVFWLLTSLYSEEVSYLQVLVLTYLLAGGNSYIVQKYFVWQTQKNLTKELPIFILINAVSILLNFVLLKVFMGYTSLNLLLAQLISIAIIACINFMIFDRVIFTNR